jgi:hypothetical protein
MLLLFLLDLLMATEELDELFTYAPALAPTPLDDEEAHATAVSTFFAILVFYYRLVVSSCVS